MEKKLYRSGTNRMFSGVCGGLGAYLNHDPTLIRILWLVVSVFTAFLPGLIVYILMACIIPKESQATPVNLKKIVFLVIGIVLALGALILLASFIFACVHDHNLPLFTMEKKLVNPGMVFLMWLCILGLGIPSGLLLRKAFQKEGSGAAEEEELSEADDSDEDDVIDEME